MPSKFIIDQAELLFKTQKPDIVIKNLKDKYTVSSFPSQMSRVKTEWYKYNDINHEFNLNFDIAYENLKRLNVPKASLKEMKKFGKDDLIKKCKKKRSAGSPGGFSGNEHVDLAIVAINLMPTYMNKYHMSSEEKAIGSKLSNESLERRSMSCIEIKDADRLLEKCKEVIKKLEEDPFTIAACLGIVCGRRSIEILKTGNFYVSERGSHACNFDGAAKKKSICSDHCEIPLLMKYKYIIDAIEYVRKKIPCDTLDNSQVNSKYSHKLGGGAKYLLNDLNARFHDLRGIYGMISFNAFSHDCSINMWLKQVLIHETLDTSIYYSRCKVYKCETEIGRWKF
jgi:hypothetical protein